MRYPEWVEQGERMRLGGYDIFYRQDGDPGGSPVTLIHGFPTSSHDWSLVLPALTVAGLRVTTLDLLGFGASAKPRGHVYTIVEQASIVESLWSELAITSTALVAHDYGVSVAQELLARDSLRITRMAWLNGGVYPDLHRPIPMQRLLHGPAGVLLGRLTSETSLRRAVTQITGRPVNPEVLHDMWLSISRHGGRGHQHRLLGYIDERIVHRERWVSALETFPGETMFIWGPADPVSGAHVLPRLGDRLPDARIVVLDQEPATGHWPQLENPTAVGDALVGFLVPRGEPA
jgi:pimeloyl-ACP methyl ester carboxylesterase